MAEVSSGNRSSDQQAHSWSALITLAGGADIGFLMSASASVTKLFALMAHLILTSF